MALRYAEAIALRANSVLTVTLVNEYVLVAAAAAAPFGTARGAERGGASAIHRTTLRPDPGRISVARSPTAILRKRFCKWHVGFARI
jgi:hypothetical protein